MQRRITMRRFFQILLIFGGSLFSNQKALCGFLFIYILHDLRVHLCVATTQAGLIAANNPANFSGDIYYILPTALVTTQAGLIAAINAANLAGGTNFITLEANITLNETSPFMSSDGATGLPPIAGGDHLTIFGDSNTLQRSFSAEDAAFRLFDVDPGASLTLDEMNIAGGSETGPIASGGAIDVHATAILTLNDDTISNSDVSYTGGGSTPVVLLGGAIYNAGTVNVVNSVIQGDGAHFVLNNGTGQGDNQGNTSAEGTSGNGSGNGLTGDVLIAGGGIYNTGNLSITSTNILDNVAIASVTNGSLNPGDVDGNGNFNGSNDTTANSGNGNGNGIVGNVTVQGGGIYNVEVLSLSGGTISGNAALCTIINGSENGNNNSDGDSGDNNGNDNGNGVTGTFVTGSVDVAGGNVDVAGGGIYNNDQLIAVNVNVTGNVVLCSVTNGSNNGGGDAVGTDSYDGDNNGDGVVGNILVSGGGIANDSAGSATIGGIVTQNLVSCSISNGNFNGSGDGDNNTGNNEGKNNGNGVDGFVVISGGGLDNESADNVDVAFTTVSFNAANSTVTNGSNNGDNDGNSNGANDGNGDGLASDLTIHGGGIHNAGTLTALLVTFNTNSVSSYITNGSNDGNGGGDNDGESEEGRANGNGVTGNVLIAGGGIANASSLTVALCLFNNNSLNSTVTNGSNNGNNDGQNDANFDNCGNNCGNAIGEGANGELDLEIDGGAIGNSGNASVLYSVIENNSVSSTITNGSGNGVGDSSNSTGASGLGDGNGVHGDLEVVGGGTANFGTMTFTYCTISGNSVSSNVTSGGNDTALDGLVLDGNVTVSGSNTFG
jgi:hypothetical protein